MRSRGPEAGRSRSPATCRSAEDAAGMVDGAVDALGRLDIVVNSAGVTARNALPPGSDPDDVWDRVIEVNLRGTYLVSRCAVAHMQRGGGRIDREPRVDHGDGRLPARSGRCAQPLPPSKGGVIQLTRNMPSILARDGIRVNCLCPGFVETDLTKSLTDGPPTLEMLESRHPLGRLGQPEEVANAALYLASDEASYVTGAALTVDGWLHRSIGRPVKWSVKFVSWNIEGKTAPGTACVKWTRMSLYCRRRANRRRTWTRRSASISPLGALLAGDGGAGRPSPS